MSVYERKINAIISEIPALSKDELDVLQDAFNGDPSRLGEFGLGDDHNLVQRAKEHLRDRRPPSEKK